MLIREQLCVCDFGRPKKLVHFVVVFTLKRVCVVYFIHGFLLEKKKGDNMVIGSSLFHAQRKKELVLFSKENHFAKEWTVKQQ